MKKAMFIAAATVTGAAIATYLLKGRKATIAPPEAIQHSSSHHITDVFANAKKRMSNIEKGES
ncbi:MAG: hypothetical protein ABIX01_00800 [Chitinophagaceae bacterium]